MGDEGKGKRVAERSIWLKYNILMEPYGETLWTSIC
jgi:hypothetical protein